ncbi:MAG TPA: ABC transporter permease [Actinomycetota bacterium]|nr:ABC transporter permease [Actinomycetota bacterium]
MFRVEVARAFRRPRTYVLGALLAGVAILPSIVLATSSGQSGGPPFFEQLRTNGLFGGLAAVGLIVPFFLPLGAGLLSGESVASEASSGTLRYLLVRPVGRVRLVLHKYAAVMTLLVLAVAWVAFAGLVAGGIAFGYGRFPTLSGDEISAVMALVRIIGAVVYVAVGVTGLAAIGVFFSTLTDSGVGAAIATVAIAIISQILDGLSSLHAIHPYLLTHQWLAFADLFRSPIAWDAMRQGVLLQIGYVAVFLAAALAVFTRKDVTS